MQTHQLQRKNPNKQRMTVARGGKRGKTAGRGGKGQSARAGNKRRPEWRDIIKRVPKLRGHGKSANETFMPMTKLVIVNLSTLEGAFDSKAEITPATLLEKGVISKLSGRLPFVKILGDGEVTKAFNITGCTFSASAKEKIEKAGGSVKVMETTTLIKNKGYAGRAEKVAKTADASTEAPKEKKTMNLAEAKQKPAKVAKKS